jgi:hypothetical protein
MGQLDFETIIYEDLLLPRKREGTFSYLSRMKINLEVPHENAPSENTGREACI